MHFFLHLGLSFWIYVVVSFVILCHFLSCFWVICFVICFVISLSFVCHCLSFWERENGKNKSLKHDYHDRPFTSWQHQIQGTVQKLLESQPAVKKDRAGELALGNSFLGLPGRGVVSPGPGCRAGSKTGWGGRGRGEMAGRARLRPEKRGRPGNSKNATLPARESCLLHFFAFFFIFFAFFFAFFLHFPD